MPITPFRRKLHPPLILAVCASLLLNSLTRAADSTPRRPSAAIVAELQAVEKEMPRFNLKAQIDPKFRHQMAKEMGPPLKRMVQLITELESVDKARALPWRSEKCLALARLAIWDDPDAPKSLTDAASSALPADVLFGKVGLMMSRWWTLRPDAATDIAAQKEIAAEFAALAKANPREDLFVSAALTMARYDAASDELANSLRDLVDQVLTGPAAEKYHRRPDKIGRPFKLTVGTIGGKSVSTAAWKGKVVIVDFWATWCPPCVASVPKVAKLYEENHPKGLEILGVSNDSSLPTLKEFLASHKEMVWPESFGPSGKGGWHALAYQLAISGIPTTFLIDRNGILRETDMGFLDEELIKQLLDEPAKPDSAPETTVKADAPPAAPAATHDSLKPAAAAAPAAAPQPAAPAADPNTDKQAYAMLALANSYIANKRPDRAAEKLTLLIEKYPNTPAAKTAKELLAQLDKPK
jgi:thiol-disulfide isomerase/thioredoxin